MKNYVCLLVVLGAAVVLTGCGGPDYEIAPVDGTITCNGDPVAGGVITFRPMSVEGAESAKPASGPVGEDGTFTLTTLTEGDGAAVGKHQVLYTPHMEGAKSYDDKPEQSPYLGLAPDPRDVEVKTGSNTIEIKLVKRSGR